VSRPLRLFEAYGVELEYMLVDARTLAVLPAADRLIEAVAGEVTDETVVDGIGWSNELALHVFELKTAEPAPSLAGLEARFQESVRRANAILRPMGGRLMPGGMHPFMDPARESRLWPHGYGEVYAAFDRIFGCRGHGWTNLQSTHLNLPFRGDDEFGRLHAAVRLVLPILPALSAASPVVERRATGFLDSRLDVYRGNCARVPSVTARVVPEAVFTKADYEREILGRIRRDLAPLDPAGVLREEWVNARGAIARFDRDAIEIRVIDAQECPAADLAILRAAAHAVRGLAEERWSPSARQRALDTGALAGLFTSCVRDAEKAAVSDPDYLACFGLSGARAAGEVWRAIAPEEPALATILSKGPLARRMLRALETRPLESVCRDLCDCLEEGRLLGA